MLATGGGLVFSGGTIDRKFHAFDATTGKLLWEYPANSGILAPPISFMVDGKQYIAVTTGLGGGSPRDVPHVIAPEIHHPANGNALYVFELPGK